MKRLPLDDPSRPDYHQQSPNIFGDDLVALVVVGLVGSGVHDDRRAPIAWMDLSGAAGHDLRRFRFALEMESSYADAYLAFSEGDLEQGVHNGQPVRLDLRRLARLFDVDRVLCLVALTARYEVMRARDYSELDLANVSMIEQELRRLIRVLGSDAKRDGRPH